MKKPYKLISEGEVPDIQKKSLYDLIIDDFISMPDRIVSVEMDDREPLAVYQSLQICIKRRNLEGKIARSIRGTKVFLKKII